MVVDATSNPMTLQSRDPTTGAVYQATLSLPSGGHNSAFYATDGTNGWSDPVTPGTYSGLTVSAKGGAVVHTKITGAQADAIRTPATQVIHAGLCRPPGRTGLTGLIGPAPGCCSRGRAAWLVDAAWYLDMNDGTSQRSCDARRGLNLGHHETAKVVDILRLGPDDHVIGPGDVLRLGDTLEFADANSDLGSLADFCLNENVRLHHAVLPGLAPGPEWPTLP